MATDLGPTLDLGNGRIAVPMHILELRAVVTFDAAASTAAVDATMSYLVGPKTGRPLFDLRQVVDTCRIDGVPTDPAVIATRETGAGPWTSVRVIDVEQAARSTHTLALGYRLGAPLAEPGGSYPPRLEWSKGSRIRWSLGMSDLFAARYLEAWFPSNLPFDQFPFTLELRIVGTSIGHALITNGEVTVVGRNAWSIKFPAWFTTMSQLLELRPSAELDMRSRPVTLPISGRRIVIETWKLAGGAADLVAHAAEIEGLLAGNERRFGEFLGTKFVCFFHGAPGGMEYGCATTTSAPALRHETFHSWFARGVSPAAACDGWWDEAYTQFNDDGDNLTEHFDFRMPPVVLCSREQFQRTTASAAYRDGSRFFRGVADVLGVPALRALMGDLYRTRRGMPVSTRELEAHIVGWSGAVELVDAFARFVYGFHDSVPTARLGFDRRAGLWVRRADDGIPQHLEPKAGQDNWICVRVRNARQGGPCPHFVVAVAVKPAATRPHRYPQDFFPGFAVAEFDLAPGRTKTLSLRWPGPRLPARGTRLALLASIHSRRVHPASGTHPWEQSTTVHRDVTVA